RLDEVWATMQDAGHGLTVTFGQFATSATEAAFSKVSGHVDFMLDVRSESKATLEIMRRALHDTVAALEKQYGVRFDLGPETTSEPATLDRRIINVMQDLAQTRNIPAKVMPCGAGHDAAVFAQM